jgi:hypothetical protein
MKLKAIISYALLIIVPGILTVSCKKNSSANNVVTGSNFWHGYIGTSSLAGPGNAILLRTDGTMREYANDYFSVGTLMGVSDTAGAKIKLDGSYIITSGSNTTVTATWYQPNGSPALTYTLTGIITGNTMAGTIKSAGTGISTVANFYFTNN